MSRLFLGKWWHWLLLAVFTALLWQAGLFKMHVIQFNSFVSALLVGTTIGLLIMIYGTRRGEQITREELRENDDAWVDGRD